MSNIFVCSSLGNREGKCILFHTSQYQDDAGSWIPTSSSCMLQEYIYKYIFAHGFPVALVVKSPPTNSGDIKEVGLIPE